MGTFFLCVQAVCPLLTFILLGYVLRLSGLVSDQGFMDLRRLAVTVLIPFTNFQSIHHADFFAVFPGNAILLGCTLVIVLFLLVSFLTPHIVGREMAPTVVHGIMHPNMSIIGIPLARELLGEDCLPEFVILLSFLCIVLSGLMVVTHQRYAATQSPPLRTVVNIFKTPILLGAILGMFFSLLPFQFPPLAENLFSMFEGVCGPLALMALGGSFSFQSLTIKPVVFACLGRLVLVPAAVLSLAILFKINGEQTLLLMLVFICPTALLCQMLSESVSGDPKIGAQIVVYSSVFSVPTIFFWLYLTLSLLER